MNIQPVIFARHARLRWRRYSNYNFAATTSIAPLAAAEVAKASIALPLAFIEVERGWTLAAMFGLMPGLNLYVDRAGSWIGSYVPAAFRAYPFRIGRTEVGDILLCIDEGSGLVVEGSEGEQFFDDGGQPSTSLTQVRNFLVETASSEVVLAEACAQLHAVKVIEPWPITVQGDHGTHSVSGLYRIDENALNALDDTTFGNLRKAGLIGLAYAQLLSMGNLANLGRLAQARAQAEAAERARAEVKPMISLPEDSSIDWDWSKIGRT